MSNMRIDKDNKLGTEILDSQQLGKEVRSWKWVTAVVGAAILSYSVYSDIKSDVAHKPLLLDTKTGQIMTSYEHVLDEYTVEERKLLAKLSYEGLRRRVGITSVDSQALNDWSGQITRGGIAAWGSLGDRWAKPHFIQHGLKRTIRVLSVVPDKANPYTFTIDSIESDYMEGDKQGERSYRVRLTLFFTDPKIDGLSRIDGVQLHSEEEVE